MLSETDALILYNIRSIHRFTRAEGKAQLQTAQSVLLFRTRSVSAVLSCTPLVLLLLQAWGQKEADGGEAEASREYRNVQAEEKEECKSTDGLLLYGILVFLEV